MPNETKHTPGPWIVASDMITVLAITECDGEESRPFPAVVDCGTGYDAMDFDEAHANAKLVARAPTLLAENETLRQQNAELVRALESIAVYETRGPVAAAQLIAQARAILAAVQS